AILRSTSLGKVSLRSRSRAPGAISLSAKSFASLRIDCCSEVRSKSTGLRVYVVRHGRRPQAPVARGGARAHRDRNRSRAPEPRLVRSPSVCATTFCAGGVSRSRTAWRASSSDARVRVGGGVGALVLLSPGGGAAPRA